MASLVALPVDMLIVLSRYLSSEHDWLALASACLQMRASLCAGAEVRWRLSALVGVPCHLCRGSSVPERLAVPSQVGCWFVPSVDARDALAKMASIERALAADEDLIVAEVDTASVRPFGPDRFWPYVMRARTVMRNANTAGYGLLAARAARAVVRGVVWSRLAYVVATPAARHDSCYDAGLVGAAAFDAMCGDDDAYRALTTDDADDVDKSYHGMLPCCPAAAYKVLSLCYGGRAFSTVRPHVFVAARAHANACGMAFGVRVLSPPRTARLNSRMDEALFAMLSEPPLPHATDGPSGSFAWVEGHRGCLRVELGRFIADLPKSAVLSSGGVRPTIRLDPRNYVAAMDLAFGCIPPWVGGMYTLSALPFAALSFLYHVIARPTAAAVAALGNSNAGQQLLLMALAPTAPTTSADGSLWVAFASGLMLGIHVHFRLDAAELTRSATALWHCFCAHAAAGRGPFVSCGELSRNNPYAPVAAHIARLAGCMTTADNDPVLVLSRLSLSDIEREVAAMGLPAVTRASVSV